MRVKLAAEANFFLGAMEVRPAACEVARGTRTEKLEPRVMQALVALARVRGEVVSRDQLIDWVWDGLAVSEDAISRAIGRIRRLSNADGGVSFQVETIQKVGYRLLAATAGEIPSAAVADAPAPNRAWNRIGAMFARRRRVSILAALAVLAALAAAALSLHQPAPQPQPALIAVLPFEPLNPGPDAQYLSDGVAASIIDALAAVGLPVASTTQSFQFRGDAQAQAAEALDAAYLVHGTVNREGDVMRVSVRMEDARRGVTVLAKTFEGSANNIPELREQIAADVAGAMSWGAISANSQNGPVRPDVLAALFRSRELFQAGDRIGAYAAARALARAAPQEPAALVNFAALTALAMGELPAADRAAALDAARTAARRAARLRPRMGEVPTALSMLTPTVSWAEREALLRRAVALSPDQGLAAGFLAIMLRHSGRLSEAEGLYARAMTATPLSPTLEGDRIDVLLALGRRAEAQEFLERVERLWPLHREVIHTRFDAAVTDGPLDQAEALLRAPETAHVIEPPGGAQPLHLLVRALRTRSAGDVAAAVQACATPASRGAARNCLVGLSMFGERDAAFALAARMYPDQRADTPEGVERRWLETAGDRHVSAVLFLPQTAPLRRDPRFIDIAERLGLVDYWRDTGRPPDFCATEAAPVCAHIGAN